MYKDMLIVNMAGNLCRCLCSHLAAVELLPWVCLRNHGGADWVCRRAPGHVSSVEEDKQVGCHHWGVWGSMARPCRLGALCQGKLAEPGKNRAFRSP